MKYELKTKVLLADFYTPVSLFLQARQKYHQVLLLESSDYSSKEDSQSFICFDSLENYMLLEAGSKPKGSTEDAIQGMLDFLNGIEIGDLTSKDVQVFGFTAFDAIQYFENISFGEKPGDNTPPIRYDLYRFVLRLDHFHDRLTVFELIPEGDSSQLDSILDMIRQGHTPEFEFSTKSEERSTMSDEDYMEKVRIAKHHLKRGDVFQLVLSRRFELDYSGDVFNVYRALRSLNPSPYLYFFEYGDYRIFGSSPEAQLIINEGKAQIHPIAGTVRRSGSWEADTRLAAELLNDPKENAEHVMLVDLARNDLSKHGHDVRLSLYKEIQYFSHVIHLTSIVEADLKKPEDGYRIFADSFPAGTLSGAPKYKALELIDHLEPTSRGFYGGAIGMVGLDGRINMAILIRSFLAKANKLCYQAGAGIVIDSDEHKELQEVNNKLAALKQAIITASKLNA